MGLRRTRKEIYYKLIHGITVSCIINRSNIEESNKLLRGSTKELNKGDAYTEFRMLNRGYLDT